MLVIFIIWCCWFCCAITSVVGIENDVEQRMWSAELWDDWGMECFGHIPTMDTYDGALMCEVLEHMTPDEGHKALCEIRRVMKPGALLCVTVPKPNGTRWDYPGHITKYSYLKTAHGRSLYTTLLEAGFHIIYRFYRDWDMEGNPVDDIPWIMVTAHA